MVFCLYIVVDLSWPLRLRSFEGCIRPPFCVEQVLLSLSDPQKHLQVEEMATLGEIGLGGFGTKHLYQRLDVSSIATARGLVTAPNQEVQVPSRMYCE